MFDNTSEIYIIYWVGYFIWSIWSITIINEVCGDFGKLELNKLKMGILEQYKIPIATLVFVVVLIFNLNYPLWILVRFINRIVTKANKKEE